MAWVGEAIATEGAPWLWLGAVAPKSKLPGSLDRVSQQRRRSGSRNWILLESVLALVRGNVPA